MKKIILLLAMATAVAFVSCKKEKPEDEFNKKDLTITGTVNCAGLGWKAGDGILVMCDGESYNFTTAGNGASADFTSSDGLTQEKVGINPLTAYYGCTQFGAFTIAQNQTLSGGESQTKLPMFAYTSTAPEKAKVTMDFTPVASLLNVTLSSADITLNKVELLPVEETGVVGNVAGAGTVNPVTGKVTYNGNLKSVSGIFQGGASLKNGLTFKMPVGWFSVTGGMKMVLTYNDANTYEEIIWDDGTFQSYNGTADAKSYKILNVSVELVMGARDFYVAPDGKASSKGRTAADPTTLDVALSSAEAGSVIHLAEGTYKPSRILLGDENDADSHKTFEIARGLTLIGAGSDKTILDGNGALHAVCVTALPDAKVILKDLAIKGGNTSEGFDENFVTSTVNDGKYSEGYGAGLYVIGSDIELENVLISGNEGKNGVGAYLNGAKASVKNCEVSGNKSTGNGCGLWASASEISLEGCTFSGNNSSGVAAGLYIYSATETTCTATVKNCVFTANETTGNNSAFYVRGADAKANVTATFTNCIIKENKGNMGGGFGTTYATVLLENCQVLKNTATGNGGNLIYPGSRVTIKDCIFRENTATQAATLYHLTNDPDASSELTVINSEFSGNYTAGRGGAIYSRAQSAAGTLLNIINCTIFNNRTGSTGSALAFYSDNAAYPSVGNIYNCTIVGNTCTRTAATAGGAIGLEKAGSTVHVYNSIVSNNIWEANTAAANLYTIATSTLGKHNIINGSVVLDADGAAVSAAPAFDAASMLSLKQQDGKTSVFSLTGDNNPAKTYGYDVAGLKALGSVFDGAILEADQWGNARTGSVMGAYVE